MTESLSPTIDLARDLIRRESVTPVDAGCQPLIADRLSALDFKIEPMRFGEVDNLWARRGSSEPLVVFAGHTDVVPTGPVDEWSADPFGAEIRDGFIYGRGAADMKGSLAAMVTATERFVAEHPQHRGSIGYLLTSDEEGPAVDGTVKVIDALMGRDENIDFCIVGEPTSTTTVGDVIKNGRRGSLNGQLRVIGQQGHVAYPHLADNPIHRAGAIVAEMATVSWDEGNEFFPPTTFQVSNIKSGTGATNVIPPDAHVTFNFRFSPESTDEGLRSMVDKICQRHADNFTIDWSLSGLPFQTDPGVLTEAVRGAVDDVTGAAGELSTTGGTSDARFIAPTGAQVIELGPVNATIHQIDEHVRAEDLDKLSIIYQSLLQRLLSA